MNEQEIRQLQQSDPQLCRYIRNRKWAIEENTGRKKYLQRIAKNSTENEDFAAKIGGILIYNQVIEQFLADIIEMSVYYLKTAALPAQVELDIELDRATFGKMIDSFRQYAVIQQDRDAILADLKKFNIKRNQVVHDLFDVKDLKQLYNELSEYARLADGIIAQLDQYDNRICRDFCRLEEQSPFLRRL